MNTFEDGSQSPPFHSLHPPILESRLSRTQRTATTEAIDNDILRTLIFDIYYLHVPILGSYLYSAVQNLTLTGTNIGTSVIRFNMKSYEWETFANYPGLILLRAVGGQFGHFNGSLYASDDSNGIIY